MSPTQRSLAWLREQGWYIERDTKVEQVIPKSFVKRDFAGCGDYIGLRPGVICLFQFTDETSHSKRLDKALLAPGLRHWLGAGGCFEVQSWGKKGARGTRKLWTLRRTSVALESGSLVVIPLPVAS